MFHLSDGFPLVTTKKVSFKGIATELCWFLSGSTDNNQLIDKGVHIWDNWADKYGYLGPIYGKQWRRFEGGKGETVDQIQLLYESISKVALDQSDSSARRMILQSWNPVAAMSTAAPVGCHSLAQFDLSPDGFLSCQVYQRSGDLFLGVPWNIASYALLTHIFAELCGTKVGKLVFSFGNVHIYENHYDAMRTQIKRDCFALPKLEFSQAFYKEQVFRFSGNHPDFYKFDRDYFFLRDYNHHSVLSGEVAV